MPEGSTIEPKTSKSLPKWVSYLVIGAATAIFTTIGVLGKGEDVTFSSRPSKSPESWREISALHPHYPDGACKSFFFPQNQVGLIPERAFDGRVPRWKKPAGSIYQRAYEFQEWPDMFGHNVPVWKELLASFAGKPGVSYLEIGVWEGRSALWMLENILTSPSASATVIDIVATERWVKNLELSGRRESVKMIVASSHKALRALDRESFDIVYIDGSHRAADVLGDAVLSWELLKSGGIMIFDDYCLDGSDIGPDGEALPLELVPKAAIDAFLLTYGPKLEILHRYYQVAVRKRGALSCETEGRNCLILEIGPTWVCFWNRPNLHKRDSKEVVELNEAEHSLLLRILRTTDVGSLGYRLNDGLASDPALPSLEGKLGGKFPRPQS